MALRFRSAGAAKTAILTTMSLALLAGGCASSNSKRSEAGGAGASTEFVGASQASRAGRSAIARLESPIATVLDELGDDAKAFHAHVTTLSNPFFEGRVPGSHGVEAAAEYLEFHMKNLGLEPAFSQSIRAADGSEVVEPGYRQHFTVPGDLKINEATFEWWTPSGRSALAAETEFDLTPFTGSGEAEGQVVFVGYSIESGADGYTSFDGDPDLTGKIALMFRFEPMTEEGASQWGRNGRWSNNAGLIPKIRSVLDRGAAGVILVSPPGVNDPRAGEIMSLRGSRFGGEGDLPVVMLAPEAVASMVEASGHSLAKLRELADAGSHGAMPLGDLNVAMNVDVQRLEIATDNVGGVLPGKGALRNSYIVIGAHYDHVGHGEFGSRSPGMLHPGADDNASGTAGMLLAAQKLSRIYDELPDNADARSIIFLGISAEEMGLLGSKHFVKEPPVALSQIDAMLNMDMIGRVRNSELEILGVGTGDVFEDVLLAHGKDSGLKLKLSMQPGGRSDHASFSEEGVPAIAFHSGLHADYHGPGDVGSKVNHKGGVMAVNLLTSVALELALRPEGVRFVREESKVEAPSQGPRMSRMSVRLGIAPGDYADDQPGVLVGDVSANTSAANAGVQKGDRIIKWNGEELLDIQGMMQRLIVAKPGDVARLVVLRDGQEVTIDVTLLPREGAN